MPILFIRRLLAPLVLAALILPLTLAILSASLDGQAMHWPGAAEIVAAAFAYGLFILAGLLFVGLPAGLTIARLRQGLAVSTALLAAIGAAGGALIMLLFFAGYGGDGLLRFVLVVGAPAGALTALIWTACNTDLFRRAPPQA